MLLFPRHRIVLVFISVSCLSAVSQTALANPVPWNHPDGTVHLYEFIDHGSDITWNAARSECEARGRYLATITSAAEQDFVMNNVLPHTSEAEMNWLGGWQNHANPDYSEPADGWEWGTGESWGYTNWHLNDPNDVGGEDVLGMWSWNGTHAYHGGWIDLPWDRVDVQGYICEIPEPTTLLLVMAAAVPVLGRRRRS